MDFALSVTEGAGLGQRRTIPRKIPRLRKRKVEKHGQTEKKFGFDQGQTAEKREAAFRQNQRRYAENGLFYGAELLYFVFLRKNLFNV